MEWGSRATRSSGWEPGSARTSAGSRPSTSARPARPASHACRPTTSTSTRCTTSTGTRVGRRSGRRSNVLIAQGKVLYVKLVELRRLAHRPGAGERQGAPGRRPGFRSRASTTSTKRTLELEVIPATPAPTGCPAFLAYSPLGGGTPWAADRPTTTAGGASFMTLSDKVAEFGVFCARSSAISAAAVALAWVAQAPGVTAPGDRTAHDGAAAVRPRRAGAAASTRPR